MAKPVVIAHRGASAYAPENTMAAFSKALSLGAGGIELDVQLSRDGHVVVIHDEKVDRTSNGKGWIKDLTLEELKKLDFGSWFSPEFRNERIPALEQVMELLESWDGLLNIEIKSGPVLYQGLEEKVIGLTRKCDMAERVIISSFNHYSLVEVKRLAPEMKTGILYMEGLVEPWEYAKRINANAIHPLFYNIIPELMEGCKKHGIAVNPFTVDQPDMIRNMAAAGVDGIITNVPDRALKIVEEFGGKIK